VWAQHHTKAEIERCGVSHQRTAQPKQTTTTTNHQAQHGICTRPFVHAFVRLFCFVSFVPDVIHDLVLALSRHVRPRKHHARAVLCSFVFVCRGPWTVMYVVDSISWGEGGRADWLYMQAYAQT
jgi:hypothetical protein